MNAQIGRKAVRAAVQYIKDSNIQIYYGWSDLEIGLIWALGVSNIPMTWLPWHRARSQSCCSLKTYFCTFFWKNSAGIKYSPIETFALIFPFSLMLSTSQIWIEIRQMEEKGQKMLLFLATYEKSCLVIYWTELRKRQKCALIGFNYGTVGNHHFFLNSTVTFYVVENPEFEYLLSKKRGKRSILSWHCCLIWKQAFNSKNVWQNRSLAQGLNVFLKSIN